MQILTNLTLLGVVTAIYGLQRLCFGVLRPIEVEQLYEKAWFAVTETCLAMTIFREEVGAWFLVMFVALLIGKVWGWIGEGRVEILEQQPPPNPRLFHFRLASSLLISLLFDSYMLNFCVDTVLRQARPNMMVMFAFEFAVLSVTSLSTLGRYSISLWEQNVISRQIKARRDQTRQQRRREAETAQGPTGASAPGEDDVDTMEFDVPGWEEKGRFVFYLDLMTGKFWLVIFCQTADPRADFCKLVLYLTFFCVLCMFYGMPIHIIRDVALTIRSFWNRIHDFVRYRQATKDMNNRYPDATPEEIRREDVCIICREDMTAWTQVPTQGGQQAEGAEVANAVQPPLDERTRPKKLPCGHILHFACLRSWLERQQNCPTCRRPVLSSNSPASAPNAGNAAGGAGAGPQAPQRPHMVIHDGAGDPILAQNVFTFGPIRFAFGARVNNAPNMPQNPAANNQPLANARVNPNPFGAQRGSLPPNAMLLSSLPIAHQLDQLQLHITQEINSLQRSADQLLLVRTLEHELQRLRAARSQPNQIAPNIGVSPSIPSIQAQPTQQAQVPMMFSSQNQQRPLSTGHEHLPPGMTLPEGWTVLPLQRSDMGDASATSNGIPSSPQGPASSDHRSNQNGQSNQTVLGQSPSTQGQTSQSQPSQAGSSFTRFTTSSSQSSPSQAQQADSSSHHQPPLPFHTTLTPTADRQGPSLTNAHSPAAPSLPAWGSATGNEAGHDSTLTNGVAKSTFPQSNGTVTEGQSSSSEPKQDKGKGRATTVEDDEDVD